MQFRNQFLCGDAIERLKDLPDESVHMCVTSPPYYGLRDYGTAKWEGGDATCKHKPKTRPRSGRANPSGFCGQCGAKRIDSQIGLEQSVDKYVIRLVEVFREVRRVLRKDGTLWLNLGDSYDTKNQIGIPWRVAFALQADGWYLRSDIIWAKPNPMPESVTDRPTKAHEYLFLLAKSDRYFYDHIAIREKQISDHDAGRGFLRPERLSFTNEDVLDPFIGSGTTALVALRLTRNFIGIDLNPKFIEMAERRVAPYILRIPLKYAR